MIRILFIFAIATTFTACKNTPETKVQTKEEVFQEVRDSIQLDSFRKADAEKLEILKTANLQTAKTNLSASPPKRTYVKGISETYTSAPPAKKGWSKAAKGAVIGAGAGAVAGVLIDKKDARGAIVGGLTGAGAGYVIGRSQDKKDGRVQ